MAGVPGSQTVIADWDDARRGDNYRLRIVFKSEGKEVANMIVQDSQTSVVLSNVATGTIVVVNVTARNATGESAASNSVEIALP